MINEKLKEKSYWVKHWIKRGLTMQQALIVIEQALQPVPDGLDKNSNYY